MQQKSVPVTALSSQENVSFSLMFLDLLNRNRHEFVGVYFSVSSMTASSTVRKVALIFCYKMDIVFNQ